MVEDDFNFNETRVSNEDGDRHVHPFFNPSMIFDPKFELGMIFATKDEFRKVVQSHTIKTKIIMNFIKNVKIRVYVRCLGENFR